MSGLWRFQIHFSDSRSLLSVIYSQTPWEGFDWFAIIYRVGAGAVPGIPESLSDEGKEFLMNCFKRDPKDRWTAEMLEGHHFVMVGCSICFWHFRR